MATTTATQQRSHFGRSSPSRMYTGHPHSFEVEMGVSPESFAPAFQFRKRHGDINWRKVAMIDVDKIARELDIDSLQEHIQTVAFCNIDAVSDLDPMFAKLFKLSQYMIEYMLHSQSSLQGIIAELEGKMEVGEAQLNSSQNTINELENDIQRLKAENKKRRKMIEQQQMLIESGASSYYKCPHCEKAFMNASFLQGHMQRKHPGSVNYIGDVIAHSQREQSKLAGRLETLDGDLQKERTNFEDKLRKAEEEKAAWGARTRRDMQKWKREEEGKWRKELDTMKKTFLEEVGQLRAQETEYKKKITSLQLTMDERHSNLGELVDDIEGEKQKLTVYAQRIRSLEQMNAEKDNQLRLISDEMLGLKDQNRRALSKHGQQMADTYDSQLRKLRQQVQDQSRRPREKEDVRIPDPDEEESLEESDGEEPERDFRSDRKELAGKMRPEIAKLLDLELQRCGIDPNATGISTQILTNKLMVRKKERERKARKHPGYFGIRNQLRRKIDEEASKKTSYPPRKKRGRVPSHLPKPRRYASSPAARQQDLYTSPSRAVPAGRIGHASAPQMRTNLDGLSPMRKDDKTMTRDELNTRYEEEESPWDSEASEQRQEAPNTTRKAEPRPTPSKEVVKTAIATRVPSARAPNMEDDSWDSDDLDDLLSPETDVRDAKPKTGGTKIQRLGANIESQIQGRTAQRPPAGAVDLMGGKPSSGATVVKTIESDDDDFSPLSSLRDESPKPAPRASTQPKVRQSTTTASSTGTSVWGSGQGKPTVTGGKNAADEVSDWDDSISDL